MLLGGGAVPPQTAVAQARWEQGTWMPGRALQSTGASLGIDTVVNIFRELLGTPLSRD